MNYLQQFIAAFKLVGEMRKYQIMADGANFWTDEDAIRLKTFLISESGKKFRARLSNVVFKSAVMACANAEAGDYRRGMAKGVNDCVSFIELHLPRVTIGQKSEEPNLQEVSRDSYEPVLQ